MSTLKYKIGQERDIVQENADYGNSVFYDCLSMVVSIKTDDKGVFATSLKNEYSLIAISLNKQVDEKGHRLWSDLQIESYLKRIAHYGNISRFNR